MKQFWNGAFPREIHHGGLSCQNWVLADEAEYYSTGCNAVKVKVKQQLITFKEKENMALGFTKIKSLVVASGKTHNC